ncbi:hypothetical protein [Actinomadura bangladeshensis]|uniref:Uncharacterized protein n=1 Tax=Actinomadura bangladeshensis TaxID=453573 RepID=A0A6L9Q9S2_9ACTN|nr:hypothetical protein [Actinomadura bangladeshensis]NEA21955.1 hypothetical protein [Actinomadura bangladeshensis]
MNDNREKPKIRSTDRAMAAPPRSRSRRGRLRRKTRRLAQAGMFTAVRGIAYTLGCALTAWLIVWLSQR